MSPEETARRHEEMAGYELVDFAEIGLPLWQISVDCISVAQRRLPPIQEFVLAALDVGLPREDLPGFLGLAPSVVEATLAQLLADRLIVRRVGAGDQADAVEVSEDGRTVLREECQHVPIEEQLPLFFDGLLRRPTAVPPEQIAYPRDTESGALVEINGYPPTRPVVADLAVVDIQRQAKARARHGELDRDVVRIRRISRYRRLFRRGVGLVFRGIKDSKDLRVRFIVGGVRAEDLEQRFAAGGGLSRPTFVKSFVDNQLRANLRRHLGHEITSEILDLQVSREVLRAVSIARLKSDGYDRKVAMVQAGELPRSQLPSPEDVEKIRAELRQATQAQFRAKARPAAVYEHAEFLDFSLRNANDHCAISSLGLSPALFQRALVDLLEKRLSAGLRVSIRLNRKTTQVWSAVRDLKRLYVDLRALASKKSGLKLIEVGEDRYFHVIQDEDRALIANRPFLSQMGRARTFEQYSGFVIQDRDLVRRYLERLDKAG